MITRRSLLKNAVYAGLAFNSNMLASVAQSLRRLDDTKEDPIDRQRCDRNTKWVFLDKRGNIAFMPEFMPWGFRFKEGYLPVWTSEKEAGFYAKNGEILFHSTCSHTSRFSDGLAFVENWGGLSSNKSGSRPYRETGYIDTKGTMRIALSRYQRFGRVVEFHSNFLNGLAPIGINDRWGFMNTSGDIVIEPQFDCVLEFKEGLAPARIHKNDSFICIDTAGNIVIPPVFKEIYGFEDGRSLALKHNDRLCYIDRTGGIAYELNMSWPEYIDSGGLDYCGIEKYPNIVRSTDHKWVGHDFHDGLIKIVRNGKYGFANDKDEIVISPVYESVNDFSEGLAAVKMNGKYGFIDKEGVMLKDHIFHHAFSFSDGLAFVKIVS